MTSQSSVMMKLVMCLCLSASNVNAFNSAISPGHTRSAALHAARDENSMSRRETLSFGAVLASAAAGLVQPNMPALAEEYLADPTAEFLESEKRAADFKKKAASSKKKFQGHLDDLNAATTDAELGAALADMRKDVIALQDLPPGFSKEALLKVIVLKKKSMLAKGLWDTPVDVIFKSLQSAITLVQSPNRMGPVE